jgi:hypothetical protein
MQLPVQQTNRGFYMKALLILSLTIFSLSAFAEKAEVGERKTDCAQIQQSKEKAKVINDDAKPAKDEKKAAAK